MSTLGQAAILSFLLPLGLTAQGVCYGPGIGADSLANTPIGKSGIQVRCRFRADPGGVLLIRRGIPIHQGRS